MNVYIVEIDSLNEVNESTIRILLSVDDPELCGVYAAKTKKERQIAKRMIPESKQEEIERYATLMLNQHKRFNKNYIVCKTDEPATKFQIIHHVINMPYKDIKDCLISF